MPGMLGPEPVRKGIDAGRGLKNSIFQNGPEQIGEIRANRVLAAVLPPSSTDNPEVFCKTAGVGQHQTVE